MITTLLVCGPTPADIKVSIINLLELRQTRLHEWAGHLHEFSVGHAGGVHLGHTQAADGTNGALLCQGADGLQLSTNWPAAPAADALSSLLAVLRTERSLSLFT